MYNSAGSGSSISILTSMTMVELWLCCQVWCRVAPGFKYALRGRHIAVDRHLFVEFGVCVCFAAFDLGLVLFAYWRALSL